MKKIGSLLLLLLTVLSLISCASGTENPTAVLHSTGDIGYIPTHTAAASPSTDTADIPFTPSSGEPIVSPDPTPSSPVVPETPTLPTLTPTASPLPDLPDPGFITEQAFVYDVQRECFLYINGKEEIVHPASTTKLLTILYARTLLPLDLIVTAGDELEMVGPNSSVAVIYPGQKITVEMLIEGMLLPSGNDAAHVLAAAGGRALNPNITSGKEAVERFMEGMNRFAKQLGLVGSVFVTPDGYDLDGHYSTLEDMAIVAREAYDDPVIRKYAVMVRDDVVYASGQYPPTWKNTNQLINPDSPYYAPEVNGLKTGTKDSSKEHGYFCLISSALIDNKAYIFGFYGSKESKDRFLDTLTGIQWIKDNL